jgi:hypothetical protein
VRRFSQALLVPEKPLYDTVLRAGVYEDGKPLLFKRQILYFIQYDYKRRKLDTDQATGTVTIEGSVYSMDLNASNVLQWVHLDRHSSGHCKDEDVRFIGTVSATAQDDQYILQCPMV